MTGYFPEASWHALWNGTVDIDATKEGRHETLNTPLGETNVHVKGGNIIPMQAAALTTAAVRASPVSLLVAMPSLEVCPDPRGGFAMSEMCRIAKE